MQQHAARPLRAQRILEEEPLDPVIEISQPPQLGADRFKIVGRRGFHRGLVYSPPWNSEIEPAVSSRQAFAFVDGWACSPLGCGAAAEPGSPVAESPSLSR